MFRFFLRPPNDNFHYATKSFPKWDYITRRYVSELSRLLHYYRNRNKFINNSHILVRALGSMLPELSNDDGSFYNKLSINAENLSKHFQFTNNISRGKLHENLFYSRNSYVLINTVQNNLNLYFLKHNWKNQQPIRVVYSNSSDLDYYIFDKSKSIDSPIPNIMSIEIDFGLMGMMYRHWYREQLLQDNNTSVSRFIANYVLPSMVISNFNIAIFNRYKNLFYNIPNKEYDIEHPFYLQDYSKGVDDVLRESLRYTTNASFPIEQILLNIPTLFGNMNKTLWLNNLNPSRQSLWTLWLSRLEYIVFLLELMGERGKARNKDRLYHLPRQIKEFENMAMSSIIDNLPLSLSALCYGNIEKIKIKVGRR